MIKGKEASKYDFLKVLPDFQEAIDKATKILNELQKFNLNNNYSCKDGRKKDYNKNKKSNKKGSQKTISFSFKFGSHIYKITFYWPKLLRLFIGDDSD